MREVSSVMDVRFSHVIDVVCPSMICFEVPLQFLLLMIEIVLIFIWLKLPFFLLYDFFLIYKVVSHLKQKYSL